MKIKRKNPKHKYDWRTHCDECDIQLDEVVVFKDHYDLTNISICKSCITKALELISPKYPFPKSIPCDRCGDRSEYEKEQSIYRCKSCLDKALGL